VRVFDDLRGAGAKNVWMSVPELEDLQRSGVFEQISVIGPASQALSGGIRMSSGGAFASMRTRMQWSG
jgi:hypothetical protein